jgi:hypothetical protein
MGRPPRHVRGLLVGLVTCLLPLLAASAAGAEVTRTFLTHEEAFVVPQGVTSINVVAIGGHGGENVQNQPGGQGARVTGSLAVTPGQILYVHVGGNGENGEAAGAAGTGGHASDVRTSPLSAGLSPDPRLIVAGAGGGAGGVNVAPAFTGESDGANVEESAGETAEAFGGFNATPTEPGEGGAGISGGRGCGESNGQTGVLELGGEGGACRGYRGGGGGDGLWGGGGGGAGDNFPVTKSTAQPGGGGGSSLVPAGGTKALAGTETPQVQISYEQPPNPPAVVTGSVSELRETAVHLNGTVNPEDSEVTSCTFEYGTTEAYGTSVACPSLPGAGITPVAESIAVSGLERATGYHWRLTATNANGTTSGADGTFTTLPQEPPTVTGVNPTEGPLGGGNSVTITGTNLNGTSVVDFGSNPATSVTVESPTTVVATAPAGTGTVDVTVTTPGGTSTTSPADRYTYVAAPGEVFTRPARGLTQTSAILEATEFSTVALTACQFEYGTSVSYGHTVACSKLPGAGTQSPEATVTGLAATTTYHFRISVSNAGGTTMSPDREFTTAGPPEYGRCIKLLSFFTGTYSGGACTTVAKSGGTFEWYPAFGSERPLKEAHFTMAIKALTEAKIETASKQLIACKGQTGNGEYTGNKTIGNSTIKFTGCKLNGTSTCTSSGAAEGEVVSSVLQGELGVISKSSEGPLKNKIGTDLKPTSGEVIAEFACAGTPVTVSGAVIVEVKRDAMESKVTLKFSDTKGLQKPTRFEGGPEEVLHVKIGEAAAVPAGLSLTTIQTNQEKIETSTII